MKKIPNKFRAQLNGKTATENYKIQKNELLFELKKRELEEYIRRAEEEEMFLFMKTMEDNAAALEQDAAEDLADDFISCFDGGSIKAERLKNRTWAAQLGMIAGRDLVKSIFGYFEDLLNYDR